MANGITHQLVAAATVGSVCFCAEANQQQKSAKPFWGAALSAMLTNLPDRLEPAIHPNHRQFFHSWAFAGMLGVAAHRAYYWETDNKFDEAVRFTILVGIGAYMVHLLLDASTPKSLPIIGVR
jgi:membrane-bound metal-dependent hydrolase YbcI (DUF457 family)